MFKLTSKTTCWLFKQKLFKCFLCRIKQNYTTNIERHFINSFSNLNKCVVVVYYSNYFIELKMLSQSVLIS